MSDSVSGWKFDPETGRPIASGQQQEEMRFDPQTGKPINLTQKQESVRFDPQTGKPIAPTQGQDSGVRFDPQTGQPIAPTHGQDSGVRFDPQTGQPIAPPQGQESGVRFDPQTGQPVSSAQGQENLQRTIIGYDGQTGQPIYSDSIPSPSGAAQAYGTSSGADHAGSWSDDQRTQPMGYGTDGSAGWGTNPQMYTAASVQNGQKTRKKFSTRRVVIPVIIAAVAVIAVIFILSNILGGGHGTQLVNGMLEAVNSLNESQLGKAMGGENFLKSRQGTLSANGAGEVYGTQITADVSAAYDLDHSQYSADVSLQAGDGGYSTSAQLYIDSSKIRLQAPALYEDVLSYDYTSTNEDSYLAEAIDEELGEDLSLEDINQIIRYVVNDAYKDETTTLENLLADTKTSLDDLDWERESAKHFRVDGDRIECRGWSTTLDADMAMDLLDRYETTIEKTTAGNEAAWDSIAKAAGSQDIQDLLDNAFAQARESLEDDDEEIELTYYMNRGKLVCILIESEDGEVELDFHGGSFTLQNMELLYNDTAMLQVEGETDGEEESWTLTSTELGGTYGYTYDADSHDLTITFPASYSYYQSNSLEGSLEPTNDGFQITVDKAAVGTEETDIDATITYSRNADIQQISEDGVDVGSLDEAELEDLILEISETLNNSDLSSLFY